MLISILEKAKIRRFGISLAATFSLIISLFASVAYSENLVARMSGHWSPKHQSAIHSQIFADEVTKSCLLYTSPSPRDKRQSRMPSSA